MSKSLKLLAASSCAALVAGAAVAEDGRQPDTPARQTKILLAEDNPVNQKVACGVLALLGCRVTVGSATGRQASGISGTGAARAGRAVGTRHWTVYRPGSVSVTCMWAGGPTSARESGGTTSSTAMPPARRVFFTALSAMILSRP